VSTKNSNDLMFAWTSKKMVLTTPAFFRMSLRVMKPGLRLGPGNQNSIQSMEKSGVNSTKEGKASEKQHQVNVDLFL